MHKLYISTDYKIVASQKNIIPPEETTNGFSTVNISLGGELKIKNQTVRISVQVHNMLNAKYFNHTSYYRLINVPEPGRSFVLNITIPFNKSLNN